jgi:nucleoside-diphosphate-sugar epimerase
VFVAGASGVIGKPLVRALLEEGHQVTGSRMQLRGASNERAKLDLAWSPRYPSWGQGFREALG